MPSCRLPLAFGWAREEVAVAVVGQAVQRNQVVPVHPSVGQ